MTDPAFRLFVPMDVGPFAPRVALHRERNWMRIVPDHEASFWLPARQWQLATSDLEGERFEDDDFMGWLATDDPRKDEADVR